MNEINRIKFSGAFDKYEILNTLKLDMDESFMSPMDHELLLGLLEKHRPLKVLEVGVAKGGTTLLLLYWLNKLGLKSTSVYSVDIDTSPECGKLVKKGKDFLPDIGKHHTLYTGKIIPEVIEEIGAGIDFVILDTFHLVPSEILDFIGVFPFVNNDAVVVLHDVGKNMRDSCRAEATKILFDSVVANKFWNWDSEDYPNIAGFQINSDTKKYISNVFLSLGMTWGYDPGHRIIDGYGEIVKKYYSGELYTLYKDTCKKSIERILQRAGLFERIFFDLLVKLHESKKVYLFGAGKMAERILEIQGVSEIIDGIIVSDDHSHTKTLGGIPVKCICEYDDIEENYIINTLTKWEVREEVNENLKKIGARDSVLKYLNFDQMFDLINAFDPSFFSDI